MLNDGYEKVISSYICPFSNQIDDIPTYLQTNPGLFKVAQFRRWMVLATGSQLIDDIKMATDDVLSRSEPVNEVRFRYCAKLSVHPQ